MNTVGQQDSNRRIRDEFRQIFRLSGMASSEVEEAVVDLFCATEGHLSVPEICTRLAERGTTTDPGTVSRVMKLLCEYGVAQEKRFEDDAVRYEHRHLGPNQHHDHLVCVRCGMVEEFYEPQIEALQDEVVARRGFRPLRHRMELYGLCRPCAGATEGLMPLAMVRPGQRVRVMGLQGGREMKHRLAGMRIFPGTVLEMMAASGSLIVGVGQTRLMLGWGVARKILVAPL